MTAHETAYSAGSLALGVGAFALIRAMGFGDWASLVAGIVVFSIPVFVVGVSRGAMIQAGVLGAVTAIIRQIMGGGRPQR